MREVAQDNYITEGVQELVMKAVPLADELTLGLSRVVSRNLGRLLLAIVI